MLQSLFWNPVGQRLVPRITKLGRIFDTVVRGYSLMGISNGERWLSSLLEQDPVIFDVGFHDGESSSELLAVRPNARVHAFDPSRFAKSAHDTRFGDDARVSFHNMAISDAPGVLTFYDYENMCNSLAPRKDDLDQTAQTYDVPVSTLDSVCAKEGIASINFLKIDAEGYDLNVIEGARGLLENQSIDIIMFEFASGWAATKRYLWEADALCKDVPYKMFHMFNGFLCPFVYDVRKDSCCTLPAMYVLISEKRLARGNIPMRSYSF
ncbi:FkbM family methyltransferase [Falsiruegeria litorea]|nr:FkbM family methyltransferase [Falsiruegeria litorea]